MSTERKKKRKTTLFFILESERKMRQLLLAQQQHQHRLGFTENDGERAKIIERSSCNAGERTIGDFTPFLHIIFFSFERGQKIKNFILCQGDYYYACWL